MTSRSRALSWSSPGRSPPRGRAAGPRRRTRRARSRPAGGEKTASPSATRRMASRQVRPGDRLGHVAARAGADDGDDVLGGVGDRQREEPHVRQLGAQRLQDGPAAAAGQVDVEQHDVGPGRPGSPSTAVVDVGGLADDVDGVRRARPARRRGTSRGRRRERPAVRHAARPREHRAPPRCPPPAPTGPRPCRRAAPAGPSTESRSPRRSSGTAAGSKPAPRSRTNTDTRSGVTSA